MARNRRSINKKAFKKQNTLVIFVEGETEENYLQYVKSLYNRSIKLSIKRKSKIKNIKDFINQQKQLLSIEDDELILLYDLEKDSVEYSKFIQNGKLIHDLTYLTQPCIEAHFLMHFSDFMASNNKQMSVKEAETELRKYLPKYRKGLKFDWHQNGISKENIDYSIQRSKEIYKGLDDEFMSTVGLLIENHLLNKSK